MKFYITEEEKRLIDEKMAQLPTRRYDAYLRKMAIDGYQSVHRGAFRHLTEYQSDRQADQCRGLPYQADMEEIREEAPLSRYLFFLKS